MCTIVLTLALVSVNCPTPVASTAEAARILEVAPGLSNRTHVYVPSPDERRRVVFVSTASPSKPPVPERSSETGRAIRMGIPGGWTPLEFAILNSGK